MSYHVAHGVQGTTLLTCIAILISFASTAIFAFYPKAQDHNLIVWFSTIRSDEDILRRFSASDIRVVRHGPVGHSFVVKVGHSGLDGVMAQPDVQLVLRAPDSSCGSNVNPSRQRKAG